MNFKKYTTTEMFAFCHFCYDVDIIFPNRVGGTYIDGTGVIFCH